MTEYVPGDLIIKEGPGIKRRVYRVCDPAFTPAGKLRYIGIDPPTETVQTSWWRRTGPRACGLPKHYHLDRTTHMILTAESVGLIDTRAFA